MLKHERSAWERGFSRVAGLDEVGRGPLAGAVVAAAVIFDKSFLESEADGILSDVTDSKKLSESKREVLYEILLDSPGIEIGLGYSGPEEIDAVNILKATHIVMERALRMFAPPPDYALVDGLPVPGLPCPSMAIVRGDSLSLSIAAASIVAKVTRDRIMRELELTYPGYGFAKHKGYGTEAHMKALMELGPSPIHRFSFQPVRDVANMRKRGMRSGLHGGE